MQGSNLTTEVFSVKLYCRIWQNCKVVNPVKLGYTVFRGKQSGDTERLSKLIMRYYTQPNHLLRLDETLALMRQYESRSLLVFPMCISILLLYCLLLQTLNRRLSELKDSLKFSNRSCEQLEQKTEELERKNKQLQKLCDIQQALLARKTENLQDLQEDHAQLKYSHEQLKAESAIRETTSNNSDKKLSSSNSKLHVCDGDKSLNASECSDLNQLQRTLAELTAEVQTSTFQKQKLQRELERVLNENQSLLKALEHADSEMAELQMKLRHFEDEFTASSPNASHLLPLTDDLSSPTSPLSHKHLKSPKRSSSGHDLSLFGELDSQYSSLQQHYEDMVKECTCSASLIHKRWQSSNSENFNANESDNGEMIDAPLKELFDEVFATLKQTTLVADKLIERNK